MALIATYPTAVYNDAPSDSAVDRAFEFVKEAPSASDFTSRSLPLLEMYVRRYAIAHKDRTEDGYRTEADVAALNRQLHELNDRLAQTFAELVRKGQIEVERRSRRLRMTHGSEPTLPARPTTRLTPTGWFC